LVGKSVVVSGSLKEYGCQFQNSTDPGGVLGGVLEPLKTDLGGVLTTVVDDI
jgi:hypothetical protein